MKILFVDQTAELGGAELSLFSEITGLEHEAEVLLFEDGPFRHMLRNAGIRVSVLNRSIHVRKKSGALRWLLAIPALLQTVLSVAARARRADLIYANSQKSFVAGALAAILTRRRLAWRLRDVLDSQHFSGLARRLVVSLANWTSCRVIANSAATARAFTAAGGNAALLSIAHPGLNESPFLAVRQVQVAAMRAEFGAAAGTKLIGMFGRLSAWKGQMLFLDALAGLPGAIGVIVGGALFGEDGFAADLHARAATLGLGRRVKFLGFRHDVPLLMTSMDIIVHCSVAPEPFGRVVVEAMLAGRPVVASAAGGVPEIIEDGKTGFLVAPGDTVALTSLLTRLAAGGAAVEAVAAAGRARARQIFTTAATVEKIAAALETVAAKPHAAYRHAFDYQAGKVQTTDMRD